MKNSSLLLFFYTLIIAIGTAQDSIYQWFLDCLFIVFGTVVIIFLICTFIQYYNSAIRLIDFNIIKLNKQINANKRDIVSLREKIKKTKHKIYTLGKVDIKVMEIVENNIELWEEQLKIHQKIIDLCQLRISALNQNRDELAILKHLIRQVKKEPDANKKISKLEKLINEIDDKVSWKVNEEIAGLIRDLKTDTRREKIIQLRTRIDELALKVG